ncbi:MAG: phasin family protein [Alphaproteobacteria bacterium]|nr:phasin family protein [Alphaproteobacteria bacterium]
MIKKTANSAPQRSAAPRNAPGIPQFDPIKLASSFGMPHLDLETMATIQRRNVETLTAICQLAFDCCQASAQRQAQVFRDTAEEMAGSFRKLSAQESPQAQAASQLEVGRQVLERGMISLRQLAELIAKTNSDAFELINQRASSCINELQNVVVNPDRKS